MRQKSIVANDGCAAIPYAEVCERVLRYLGLVGYPRDVRIHASKEYGTHWLLTWAVPSIEDPSRMFKYASIVAEKQTGHLYAFPSRARQPIDSADMISIQRECTRITPDDLDELEKEGRSRRAK
jgi:hypothetical protein